MTCCNCGRNQRPEEFFWTLPPSSRHAEHRYPFAACEDCFTGLTKARPKTLHDSNAERQAAQSARIRERLVKSGLYALLALLLPLAARAEEKRTFHPVPLDHLATGTVHTHVETSGRVEFRRSEDDGDVHLRVCGPAGGCVVAECIPEIPSIRDACKRFRKGSQVTVRGITRYDSKHRWWEVHPVLGIEGGQP